MSEPPGPIVHECMCGGICSTFSSAVYRLWNGYTDAFIRTDHSHGLSKKECITSLESDLATYESKGTISWFVAYGLRCEMRFDTGMLEEVVECATCPAVITAGKLRDAYAHVQCPSCSKPCGPV